MPTPVENAVTIFNQDLNCSQAVFGAFAPQLGVDLSTALKLASPFGGGMARRGEVCGAVSGGLLALGLARGADQPSGKQEIYRLSQEFMRRFEEKHGTLLCRLLIGLDLGTAEGWQKAREDGKFKTVCPFLVQDAASIVQALLETA